MASNTKFGKEREATDRLAEMTYRYFEKLPKAEQKIRLKAMKNLGISVLPLLRVFRNVPQPQ